MTTRKDRRVTIVVHTDGDLASRQYRVPVWAFEAGKWGALVVGLLVVLFFAFAGPIGPANAKNSTTSRPTTRAPHFPASNAHTGTRYCREARSPSVWTTMVTRRSFLVVIRRTACRGSARGDARDHRLNRS